MVWPYGLSNEQNDVSMGGFWWKHTFSVQNLDQKTQERYSLRLMGRNKWNFVKLNTLQTKIELSDGFNLSKGLRSFQSSIQLEHVEVTQHFRQNGIFLEKPKISKIYWK